MNDNPTAQTFTAANQDPHPLAACLPDGPATTAPVVTVPNGTDVVVLQRIDAATVEVWHDNRTLRLADDVPATPVADPDRREQLTHGALSWLAVQRQQAIQTIADLREEREQRSSDHEQVLGRIRQYAIDKHRTGDICRGGLDAFLDHFDMSPYEPRLRVNFHITGSVQVDTDDRDTAAYQVGHYLGLDIDDVDHAVEDGQDIQVTVTSVEPVHD
ncbi:hypothetical protein WEI85_19800 [Actinomycetes bacterium KLBMP 9797]